MLDSKSSGAFMMRSILSIALVLGFAAEISAQSVQPSNTTLAPPLSGTNLQLRLRSSTNNRGTLRYTVAPLTLPGGLNATTTQLSAFNIDGMLVLTDANNANAIGTGDIAYTTCERDVLAQFTPDQVVAAAASQRPKAILLYTTETTHCTLTGSFGYDAIYTMTNASDSENLVRILGYNPSGRLVDGVITTESSQSRGGNNNDGGPAPTTAVAMSILYSITGIITLLFLVIICSGALRAHRNPERYGPRSAVGGRPRQSRAKGLARAMLETIPIVKFGDPEPKKAESERDIELADNETTKDNTTTATDASKKGANADKKEDKAATPASETKVNGDDVASGLGQAESVKSGNENLGGDGEIGCSICTEDFTAGEDVRVLPCHHKYHPACIDPWLLNVSGTCPLCRHDLNPAESAENAEQETNGLAPPLEPTPETAENDAANPGRRRISRFLDLHRLRTATPDERIAALRRLREQSRAENATVSEEPQAEEPVSRSRLRDRFRFGGRSNPSQQTSSTSTDNAVASAPSESTPAART